MNIVLTGSTGGIGAVLATHLQARGHHVHTIARTMPTGVHINHHIADLSSDYEIDMAVQDIILATNARIDALITCHANGLTANALVDTDIVDYSHAFNTDVLSTIQLCKAFAPYLNANGCGRVINFTSFHTEATYPNRTLYVTTKAALKGFSQALAVEWGKYGTTVNCIAPGPVDTARSTAFRAANGISIDVFTARTPNHRMCTADELTHTVDWLLHPNAGHVNGQTVVVDGGWTKSAWWGDYNVF